MKVGDLVRITRASIGIPADTIALIIRSRTAAEGFEIYDVKPGRYVSRRYLARDLEIVSGT